VDRLFEHLDGAGSYSHGELRVSPHGCNDIFTAETLRRGEKRQKSKPESAEVAEGAEDAAGAKYESARVGIDATALGATRA
jgi:hypothetical protein